MAGLIIPLRRSEAISAMKIAAPMLRGTERIIAPIEVTNVPHNSGRAPKRGLVILFGIHFNPKINNKEFLSIKIGKPSFVRNTNIPIMTMVATTDDPSNTPPIIFSSSTLFEV